MKSEWSDKYNLIKKLSFKKVLNGLLLLGSFYISRKTKKNFHAGFPLAVSIEPTTSCNLRCPECPSGLRSFTRPTGMLQEDKFAKIINQLKDHLLYLIFYFQGEPYLNPRFLDMVAYASKNKIYTATSTNGHYLNDINSKKTVESGLDRLIISIDGTTQETYESYRVGGDLQKVLQGVKNVVSWKNKLKSKTPHIVIQFLVVKPNEHQVIEMEEIAKDLGVENVVFKTAQIYDYENGSEFIPVQEKFSRYRKRKDGKYEIKNKLLNECWKMWHSCVITWDGNVVPCCFDKDATYKLGDLNNVTFKEIWKGNQYQAFRSSLLISRKEIDICRNCTEGTKVLEEI